MRTQQRTQQPSDIVAVMAAHGVALEGDGPELKGLCPFHEDHIPSLSVNRDKGVWHCFGCGAKGNARVFVERIKGRLMPGSHLLEKVMVPSNVITDTGAVIERVIQTYHETLSRNKTALAYLIGRGIGDPELLRRYRVGFADGGLKRLAPARSDAAVTLKRLGYLNERGNEHFAGCVTFPITDAAGAVVGMYGRRVIARQGAPKHLYLPGPHRGVWNREGAKAAAASGEPVIICECVIDALSCAAAGMPGAIALYGAGVMTAEHLALLAEPRPGSVVLMLDADEAGRKGAAQVVEKLAPLGLALSIARLPEGADANQVLVEQGAVALRAAVEKAEPIAPPRPAATTTASAAPTLAELPGGDLAFTADARAYHVKNFNAFGFARMRATLLLANTTDGAVHIDTLDLYSNRARAAFVSDASARLGIDAATIEADLLNLTLALDEYRKRQAEKMQGKAKSVAYEMTQEEKAAGMAFLTAPDLLAEIVADYTTAGYVGEEKNKALAYLVATSRKMREPLSVILIAASGAGKSALLDVVEVLMPAEDLYAVSDMTDNALFYVPEGDLTHKLLIVAERSGSEGADYSLRELQTKRSITKAVAVKDPETGRIKTIMVTVKGPVAVMESTTNPRMNPENANRCFVLHVDESREQTEAIQRSQRRAKGLIGLERDAAREAVIMKHQAAQRLLEPVRVVIPFAEKITFPAETVRTRRDHARFLNLIEAVAFLHQKKRPTRERHGQRYIEATLEDYETARGLALEVLTANLDELPRASRALLDAMESAAMKRNPEKREAAIFTRRDLVDAAGWTYDQIRTAIAPLLDNDHLLWERGPRGMALYRLGAKNERPTITLPTSAEISRVTP